MNVEQTQSNSDSKATRKAHLSQYRKNTGRWQFFAVARNEDGKPIRRDTWCVQHVGQGVQVPALDLIRDDLHTCNPADDDLHTCNPADGAAKVGQQEVTQ